MCKPNLSCLNPISRVRSLLKLSQTQASELLGISSSGVCRREAQTNIGMATLVDTFTRLNVEASLTVRLPNGQEETFKLTELYSGDQ